MDPEYKAMVISGQPASGASTAAERVQKTLEEKYGVEWAIGHFSDIWRKKHKNEAPDKSFDRYWKEDVTPEDNKEADFAMRDKIVSGEVQINDGRYIQPYLKLNGRKSDGLGLDDILLVQMTADMHERVRRLKNSDREDYRDLTPLEIKIKLKKREIDELEEAEKNYRRDHTNPEHYDLVLDTTDMGRDEVVEEIIGEIVSQD